MISIMLGVVSVVFFYLGFAGVHLATKNPAYEPLVMQLFMVSALFAIAAGVWR